MSRITYYSETHVFTTRSSANTIRLKAGDGKTLLLEGTLAGSNVVNISSVSDFPDPIVGVITLLPGTFYYITGPIDLMGSRLVLGLDTVLQGTASRIASITSTGLGIGIPMITSIYGTDITNLSLFDVDTLWDLQSSSSFYFLNFENINVFNVPNVGLISGYISVIATTGGFTNCLGLRFDGTMSLVSFLNFVFASDAAASGTLITVEPTSTFVNKFVIDSCILRAGAGKTIINFSTSASIRDSGYILLQNFFDGLATYQTGVTANDNKSSFNNNVGIDNTRSLGGFYLSAETATTVVEDVWTKALGTTTANPVNSKFTSATNNRLVYTGSFTEVFAVNISVNLIGNINNNVNVGISLNGANPSAISTIANSLDGGAKGSTYVNTFYQQLNTGDYLEIWIRNNTSSFNVTAIQLSLSVG